MKLLNITVSDRVVITNKEIIGSGNVNTVKCVFSFEDNWENLEKIARFEKDGIVTKRAIIDNECFVPSEVLETVGVVCIGVYGYELENDEIILRESPVCTEFIIKKGSYIPSTSDEEIDEEEVIEATDYEKFVAIANEIKNTTEEYKDETNQYKTETKSLKNETQTLKEETLNIKNTIETLSEEFEENSITKLNEYNTNATTKLNEYNTKATDVEKELFETKEEIIAEIQETQNNEIITDIEKRLNLLEGKRTVQTTFDNNIIKEIYDDESYKITEFNSGIIYEKWYSSDNTLILSKTTTVANNSIIETIN